MQFYLSSYKLGNETEKLKELFLQNPAVGYIPNALDFTKADPVRRQEVIDGDLHLLKGLGLESHVIDLREYFGRDVELRSVLAKLGGLWVSGGNTFVLRQAMKLSGLDVFLKTCDRKDFVYGGYSAAGCVLSPSLDVLQIVDDPHDFPYSEQQEILWDGLGLIDFAFLPHFDSDHSESADIEKERQRCIEMNIPYKTLRDGEVLIFDR